MYEACGRDEACRCRAGSAAEVDLETTEALAKSIADLALDRKALDVIITDLRGRSSYTDFLVIASGTSDRHVQAVAEHVEEELRKAGTRALGSEGLREGQWALVDFGPVVLHVFHEYTRQVYDLEGIWSDAPRLRVEEAAARSRAEARASL